MKLDMLVRIVLWALILGNPLFAELPQAEVTVHVTDQETGEPISSAAVAIGFSVGDGHGATTHLSRRGTTDRNGNFKQAGGTLPDIVASAIKSGYYRSGIHFDLRLKTPQSYDPSDVTLPIILKHVGKPAAMYARKRARLELPKVGEPLGFDLVAFDWVAPHGKGQFRDFVFTLSDPANAGSQAAKTLLLTFGNDGDGIQSFEADSNEGSELRLPAVAPESGYAPTFTQRADKTYAPNKKANYFFRVRTTKDGPMIRSGLYGKIHGDIGVDTINSKTALIFLTYYLNPDGTRNIEFDPNKNLFKDLPASEQVRDP